MYRVKFRYYVNELEYINVTAKAKDVTDYGPVDLKLKMECVQDYVTTMDQWTLEDIEERITEKMLYLKYVRTLG